MRLSGHPTRTPPTRRRRQRGAGWGVRAAWVAIAAALPGCASMGVPTFSSDASAFGRTGSLRLVDRPNVDLDVEHPRAVVRLERVPGAREISIDYEVRAATRELADQARVSADWTDESTLRIRGDGPRNEGEPQRWFVSRVDVRLPAAHRVRVRTVSGRILVLDLGQPGRPTFADGASHSLESSTGSITVRELLGAVTLKTRTGRIVVAGGDGDVVADTGSADIEVERRPNRVRVNTSSGRVTLRNVTASFDVVTLTGDVQVALDRGFTGTWVTNTKTGRVTAPPPPPGGGSTSRVTTTSGNIRITRSGS
jgi:hypothetical protein